MEFQRNGMDADQPECENLTVVELIDIIRQFHYYSAVRQMQVCALDQIENHSQLVTIGV